MRRFVLSTVLAAAVSLGGGAAQANGNERRTERAAAVEYLVERDGGAFEVAVNPAFVTVLYFPEKITTAVASEKSRFEINPMGPDSIALRPKSAEPITANLLLRGEKLRVSVILRVAAREEAVSQVVFKLAEEEAEVTRRVEERVKARLRAHEERYRKRQLGLEREVQRRAEETMAAQILDRHEVFALRGIARNDHHIILRAQRLALVGDDGYLIFEIQNRSEVPYRLASTTVTAAGKLVSRTVRLGRVSGAPANTVPAGSRATGVVSIRDADRRHRTGLELTVTEAGGGRPVTIRGIEVR